MTGVQTCALPISCKWVGLATFSVKQAIIYNGRSRTRAERAFDGQSQTKPPDSEVLHRNAFLGPVRIMEMDFYSNHSPIQFSFHPFPTKLIGTEI